MEVYDPNDQKVGRVTFIQFGNPEGTRDQALDGDLPEVMQNRLWQHGFIRIEGDGLLAPKYYAMPDQIAKLSSGHVVLSVPRDELIKLR